MEKGEIIRVLIVDDDEEDFFITKTILGGIKNQHYDVTWASRYDCALIEIKKNTYDIFLVDYNLGEKTGLDFVDESLNINRNVPIILLTGLDDRDVDIMAMKKGVSEFLRKGRIDEELLERSIRYAIEKKRTESQILYLAYYDQVTNLPNRVFFKEQLNYALAHAIRYKRQLAVLFLDLDNFKLINDSLGHHIGDMLLKEVAKRLYASIRKSDIIARNEMKTLIDTVARLGGDEFTISLTEISSFENASMVANRIIELVNAPYSIDGHEIFIGVSIGISVYPIDTDSADNLLKYADNAMYYAKKQGKNCYQYYRKSMNDEVLDEISMTNSLRKAVDKSEFVLHYQPKMEVSTGKLIGFESLIRWNTKDKGLVQPLDFIPIAEKLNLIGFITDWVIKEVCRQIAEWKQAGLSILPVSINLPVIYFKKPDFIESIKSVAGSYGITPDLLELEVTESIFMDDIQFTILKMEELSNMGFKQIPCDILKIDRSFIRSIEENLLDSNIVDLIIAMGHGLQMVTCAEGVETRGQFDFIRNSGCDYMQGYLLGKPKPQAETAQILVKEAAGEGIGIELVRSFVKE
jgi:diguanylate cyclase (GGDEF)-like protein